MATLTIRNVDPRLVKTLKQLAQDRGRSMEQEVRELLEESVGERLSVLQQIEESWKKQKRRPSARTVDRWVGVGRP
jgi:antitoxin FitA